MKTVRTTVTLPEDLHDELRWEAFRDKKSLGEVLTERLQSTSARSGKISDFSEDIFDTVALSGKDVDLLKALREERNRDD